MSGKAVNEYGPVTNGIDLRCHKVQRKSIYKHPVFPSDCNWTEDDTKVDPGFD